MRLVTQAKPYYSFNWAPLPNITFSCSISMIQSPFKTMWEGTTEKYEYQSLTWKLASIS